MKVLVPGHRYELTNLKANGSSILQFHQDGFIHGETIDGPSTQEVIRACIDRVKELDKEKHWDRNHEIIQHGKMMIAEFEMRALYYKVLKGGFAIENMPVEEDGHIWLIR